MKLVIQWDYNGGLWLTIIFRLVIWWDYNDDLWLIICWFKSGTVFRWWRFLMMTFLMMMFFYDGLTMKFLMTFWWWCFYDDLWWWLICMLAFIHNHACIYFRVRWNFGLFGGLISIWWDCWSSWGTIDGSQIHLVRIVDSGEGPKTVEEISSIPLIFTKNLGTTCILMKELVELAYALLFMLRLCLAWIIIYLW